MCSYSGRASHALQSKPRGRRVHNLVVKIEEVKQTVKKELGWKERLIFETRSFSDCCNGDLSKQGQSTEASGEDFPEDTFSLVNHLSSNSGKFNNVACVDDLCSEMVSCCRNSTTLMRAMLHFDIRSGNFKGFDHFQCDAAKLNRCNHFQHNSGKFNIGDVQF